MLDLIFSLSPWLPIVTDRLHSTFGIYDNSKMVAINTVQVEVEYCGGWGYGPRYRELADMISAEVPGTAVQVILIFYVHWWDLWKLFSMSRRKNQCYFLQTLSKMTFVPTSSLQIHFSRKFKFRAIATYHHIISLKLKDLISESDITDSILTLKALDQTHLNSLLSLRTKGS